MILADFTSDFSLGAIAVALLCAIVVALYMKVHVRVAKALAIWSGYSAILLPHNASNYEEPKIGWLNRDRLKELGPVRGLDWEARLVQTVVGRVDERKALIAWACDGKKSSKLRVRFVSGEAGCGKTRLVAEVGETLRKRRLRPLGWKSIGFVRPAEISLKTPAFVVFDDRDSSRDEVMERLREIYHSKARWPVCVVIVCRDNVAVEAWKYKIRAADSGLPSNCIGPSSHVSLNARLSDADAWELFRQAYRELTRIFKDDEGSTAAGLAAELHAKFNNWVNEPHQEEQDLRGRPLYTLAAALHAFLEPNAVLGIGAKDVIDKLSSSELTDANAAAKKNSAFPVAGRDIVGGRLLALAAVRGSLQPADLKMFAQERLAISLPPEDQIVDAVRRLDSFWQNGSFVSVRPRIIANAIAWKVFEQEPDPTFVPELLLAALTPGRQFDGDAVAHRLGRLVYDVGLIYGDAAEKRLRGWLKGMIPNDPQLGLERAKRLSYLTDSPGAGLQELRTVVIRQLLKEANGRERAQLLQKVATAYARLNLIPEAIAADREAVQIRRVLTADAGDENAQCMSDLADSLNSLAAHLTAANRLPEALGPIEEAVRIRRELVAKDHWRYIGCLAESLLSFGELLRLLDSAEFSEPNRDEPPGDRVYIACDVDKEAAKLYRELAKRDAEKYCPTLAASLNNLSIDLGALGKKDEGLAAIQESVKLYRDLASKEPEEFEPFLANVLNNLSIDLARQKERQNEALEAGENAVAIYCRLAKSEADVYNAKLAVTLTNLSSRLSAVGRRDEALSVIDRAVTIRRELTVQNESRYEARLAESLVARAERLGELNRTCEALEPAEEAVTRYRKLTEKEPGRHRLRFANALDTLAERFEAVGRAADACKVKKESASARQSKQ
jgi:hypothetical protein